MPDSLSIKYDNKHTVCCFVTAKCCNKISEVKEAGSNFF